ncbi:MAG: dihydrodipicolinate synthase family protein [Sulfobacillus sp.]
MLIYERHSACQRPASLFGRQAFELGKSGDFHAAGEFQRKLLRLHEVYYQGFGSHASSVYSCVKEALHQMGLCESVVTPPIPRLAEENKKRVRDILLDVGLLR